MTGGRARVDVHEHVAIAECRAHFTGRLHRSDFVIGELDADERRVGAHRVDDLGNGRAANAVDANH